MEQVKRNTDVAGIDVSKSKLDAGVLASGELAQFGNDAAGFEPLVAWLQASGFEVVVHQPLEVKLFARLKRLKAKNDRLDAMLIAAATAQVEAVKAAADPLLWELGEWMTAYEQGSDQLARLRTCLEQVSVESLRATYEAQIEAAKAWKQQVLEGAIRRIKAREDLARRYALLMSLPGVGPVVAASLVVRMPELGALSPGEAASLLVSWFRSSVAHDWLAGAL